MSMRSFNADFRGTLRTDIFRSGFSIFSGNSLVSVISLSVTSLSKSYLNSILPRGSIRGQSQIEPSFWPFALGFVRKPLRGRVK